MYALCMLSERLQILVEPAQRRLLETEARRRGTSVGALVREAIDLRYGATTREDRLGALQRIVAMRGTYLPPAALDALVDEERDAAAGRDERP